jgi:hypothetical protein
MQENNSKQDYTGHPCYDPKSGVLHGWMCPFCLKIYPSEEQAKLCKDSHDDFQIDYLFEKGYRFPTEIIVKRVKGNQLIEIGTYIVDKVEVMNEDGKVKETIKGKKI